MQDWPAITESLTEMLSNCRKFVCSGKRSLVRAGGRIRKALHIMMDNEQWWELTEERETACVKSSVHYYESPPDDPLQKPP